MQKDAAAAYDAVTRTRSGDMRSGEVPFRHFCNFVKKLLIQHALDTLYAALKEGEKVAVLDLASGRGGDIGKWLFMHGEPAGAAGELARGGASKKRCWTTFYDCFDISPQSIAEARQRHAVLRAQSNSLVTARAMATFTVADCFDMQFLTQTLPHMERFGTYHVVSIQFALHYACDTDEHVEALIRAVAAALRPGGLFIATTVDPLMLSRYIRRTTRDGEDDKPISPRNALFSVHFLHSPLQWEPVLPTSTTATDAAVAEGEERVLRGGTAYDFTMDGFVDCTEYVVPMTRLRQSAASAGLVFCPVMSHPFADYLAQYESVWRNNKGNKLSEEERQLVTLYTALCFHKEGDMEA